MVVTRFQSVEVFIEWYYILTRSFLLHNFLVHPHLDLGSFIHLSVLHEGVFFWNKFGYGLSS